MKVLHLIYDHVDNPWVGGGGAVRAREIYRRISERHRITVVCGKYPGAKDYTQGDLNFHFEGTEINNYVLSTSCYAVAAIRFLRRYGDQSDVVVEDFAPYNPLFTRFLVKPPSIIQVHHREGLNLLKRYFVFGVPYAAVERIYPRSFGNAICVSEESKKRFGLFEAAVIPNGIENTRDSSFPERDYLSYVGRIHIHNKGLDTLIEAMKDTDAKLEIAGRGRDEERLSAGIRKAGLAGRVKVRGYLMDDDKEKFIARSQFLVLPSRYEGQGIVVLEAAACGRPVIVSDIPELHYAVEAGFALAFRTGDSKDLAEKMKSLLDNEAMRKEMGSRAIRYAKNFTWDRIAAKYEEFLLDVAHGGESTSVA